MIMRRDLSRNAGSGKAECIKQRHSRRNGSGDPLVSRYIDQIAQIPIVIREQVSDRPRKAASMNLELILVVAVAIGLWALSAKHLGLDFDRAIKTTDRVAIYEGLPHQTFEPDLLANELLRPDISHICEFPFYDHPIEVTSEEKRRLSAVALHLDIRATPVGLKLCGGFHPDFAVVWERRGKRYGMLICFGSNEWKRFTPHHVRHETMSSHVQSEMRQLLSGRNFHRPLRTGTERETGTESEVRISRSTAP